MDLQDQLRNFFPNHKISENPISEYKKTTNSHTQTSPLLCKYEKRKGKPNTIIEGFEKIKKEEIKLIAKSIKQKFSVGGSIKGCSIIIQGNIRDDIMNVDKMRSFFMSSFPVLKFK